MALDEHKRNIRASFDMASDGYDCPSLRFFAESASHLIKTMNLSGDEKLLDIATGTGHVALCAARELINGSVTGIDLSEKMLRTAINKAAEMNLSNVAFKQCDIDDMGFEDHTFDAASCAFGLFFLPDIENGLKRISRVLKPGGILAVTSFSPSLMMPLREMFFDRIKRYGIEGPKRLWMQMDSPEKLNSLLFGTGCRDIQIESKQMGYYLNNALQWRDVLWNSGYRGMLSRLSDTDLQRFMKDHLLEIESTADENGIWLEVEVLFATAKTEQ